MTQAWIIFISGFATGLFVGASIGVAGLILWVGYPWGK
jgi:hypothetical protein